MAASPFDDIRNLFKALPPAHEEPVYKVRNRDRTLVKPAGSLGRLEEIVEWLAAWQGKAPPQVLKPQIAVYASNHGVAGRGVSAYPQAVTRQMVDTFAAGGGAVNQLALASGAGLKVFDLALDVPTPDISTAAALSERDCAATMAFGMEAVAQSPDILCLGEMGIGNTTVAAALAHALFGGRAEDWVGRGTGVDDQGVARKRAVVEAAIAFHGTALEDPLEALRRVGGREFAAIAGAILAARISRVPVLLDGFPVTAAAAVLYKIDPRALDHCMAAHVSTEPGHRRLLDLLEKPPVLDLEMRLGEGSGAALALNIVQAAVAVHTGMATFEQAKVSGPQTAADAKADETHTE
ncbi:MAG: nicotinate-nucleotide--dimethylbenzimidazole phosphoribosyltransferase [Alphaproteobacteria bacterium]